MRHLVKGRTLGRGHSHRKGNYHYILNISALLRNLTTQLVKYGKIKTTLTRAKELRMEADKMVTISKKAVNKECNQHEKQQL
jgi:large subunit ribosomal protein L17